MYSNDIENDFSYTMSIHKNKLNFSKMKDKLNNIANIKRKRDDINEISIQTNVDDNTYINNKIDIINENFNN